MTDEARAAEILRAAKAQRRGSSRGLWIAALVIGAICAIGFVLLFVGDRAGATTPPRVIEDHGLGFGAGVVLGVTVGIVIGYAIARQRQSARSTP